MASAGKAQLAPPTFGCIGVAASGDATLNWTPPSDPGGTFTQYDIFVSAFAGAGYVPLASIPSIGTTTYTETTTATLSDNQFYFMQTLSSDGSGSYTSVNSDTLSSIYLTATPSILPLGYAQLDWNSPFVNTDGLPAGLQYEVWREFPAGSWNIIEVLPFGVTNWDYEITACSPYMNFQIRLWMPSGCQFISNIAGDDFENLVPAIAPVVTSISIDHVLNDAVITWQPSTAVDIGSQGGYYIYECIGGSSFLVQSNLGVNNTQFTDIGSSAATGPVSYQVAAFDSCYIGVPPVPYPGPPAPCQTSVYLPGISFFPCNDFTTFHWTAYEGWDTGVDYYIIHHATTPGPTGPPDASFTVIDTVPGNDLNYTHVGMPYNVYNWYYIEAVSAVNGFHAVSNIKSTADNTPYPVPPGYVYLASASVISNDSVSVLVEIDPTILDYEYTLQRYDQGGDNWDEVMLLLAGNTSSIQFIDGDVSADVFAYTYRVIVKNQCGQVVDTTNLGRTVLLDGLVNTSRLVNVLSWTPYGGWENEAASYRIHRKIGENGADVVIADINGNAEKFYEDDVSTLLYTDGAFCYTIEAVENPSSLPIAAHTAFSNELCLIQDPVIWIPNAFVVDGYNRTFSPVISFADFTNYRMIIYSRWGDIIYESTDITVPWDGTMNGKTVQEGSYTYYMSVKDGQGRVYDETGYVLLLVASEK